MSLLSRQLESKATSIPVSRGQQYQLINGRLVSIEDNQKNYIDKGYNINDIVYSIVKLIMDKVKVTNWGVYKIEDEQAYKRLKSIQRKSNISHKEFLELKSLSKKALVLSDNPGKLGELVKYPNEYESMSDHVASGVGYRLLTGNKYTWFNTLKGGANAGLPQEMWMLPSQYVDIYSTDSFPSRVEGYSVKGWPSVKYLPEEILHEKYWNPNWDINGQQLYGVSPLKAALRLLGRNNSSLTASASAFQNEGIKGILHMKGVPGQVDGEMLVKEVASLKQTMVTEWAGEANRGRIGLGGYDMGWLPIGLSAEDMQLIESEKWDLRRLCSVYGVQSQLLNDPDNKTYNNQQEAEKALTLRCALPELVSYRDCFNRKAEKEKWKKPNEIVDFDMSVYSELQDNVKDVSAWTSQLLAVSPNEQRELCGLESVDNPALDEVWVQQIGRMPLTDFQMNAVDESLNNDGEEDI